MIYLDNAATGGFKPNASAEAAVSVIRHLCANPGRSGHRLAVTGAKIVYETRERLANFFGADKSRVIFTKNCTEALNLAIFGSLKAGGRIITTALEHNSVLRPLTHLQSKGLISLDVIYDTQNIVSAIAEKANGNAYMVITTGASNVTGEVLPIREIGKLCEERGLLYLVDGAQAGGHVEINLKEDGVSMLALAGHKGLYGIMGSGALIFNEQTELSPVIFGGTGTESLNSFQPSAYPERLESGTLNLPAIASLGEGIRYAEQNFSLHKKILTNYTSSLIDALRRIENLSLYSEPNPVGIVSFSITGKDSDEVAQILNDEFDVAVRGGFHCAPLCHKKLGTDKSGLVRVSFAPQNGTREATYLIKAIKSIAERG